MSKLSSPSLVALAAEALRERILAVGLSSGESLREERLATELDISRPPLREALRLLESERLVSQPRRGTIVAPLREQDAWEIAALSSSLERTAMELALPINSRNSLVNAGRRWQ